MKPVTRVEQVRDVFLARVNQWIDGLALAKVGGAYGWRSRVSDCRLKFGMTIENRQRWVVTGDGQGYTVSEYRFVPSVPVVTQEDATGWSLTP